LEMLPFPDLAFPDCSTREQAVIQTRQDPIKWDWTNVTEHLARTANLQTVPARELIRMPPRIERCSIQPPAYAAGGTAAEKCSGDAPHCFRNRHRERGVRNRSRLTIGSPIENLMHEKRDAAL
jgi:hypothetical protein